jgi:ankyrin repeat protein
MLALLFVESFKGKFSVEDVNTTLRNLPTGSDAYDSAYFAAMERIHAQDKDASQLATKILSWILCARRPLSTSELLHALAVKVGERNFNEDRILDTEQLITVCAGLVTIDGSSDSVRFIHYTTQEYLQRNRIKWLPHADIETARICTAYLSLDDLSTGPCYSRQEFDRRVETLALLDYAAVHWGSHMSVLAEADLASELGGEVEVEVICFLSNVKCLSSASQALFISDEDYPFAEEDIARQGAEFSGSHWIGRFGLANFFRQWDCREAQWDKRDVDGRTPLSWAAGEGHGAVSELLLETVDVNSEDTYGQTPLSWACQNAEESVAKLLLSSNKVEVDIADGSGFTPLLWAIMRGHKAIVKLLLGSDTADVEFKNEDGQTLLFIACEWGQEAVVKLLLDTGKANVNFKSRDGQTPLIMAARDRCTGEAMIKLLLDTSKVEVDWKDDYGRTALQYAATNGQEAPVKLLLDTGKVDVNSKDKKNGTPLGYATENGHGRIVKLLLDAGAVPLLPAFSPEIPAAKIAT